MLRHSLVLVAKRPFGVNRLMLGGLNGYCGGNLRHTGVRQSARQRTCVNATHAVLLAHGAPKEHPRTQHTDGRNALSGRTRHLHELAVVDAAVVLSALCTLKHKVPF